MQQEQQQVTCASSSSIGMTTRFSSCIPYLKKPAKFCVPDKLPKNLPAVLILPEGEFRMPLHCPDELLSAGPDRIGQPIL